MDEEVIQRIKRSVRSRRDDHMSRNNMMMETTLLHKMVEFLFLSIVITSIVSAFLVPVGYVILPIGFSITFVFALDEHNTQKRYGVFQHGRKVFSDYSPDAVFNVILWGFVFTFLVFYLLQVYS